MTDAAIHPATLRALAFGLRLRIGSVAFSLERARLEHHRRTMSALEYHATSLRRYAERAPELARNAIVTPDGRAYLPEATA